MTEKVKKCLELYDKLDKLWEKGLGELEEADQIRDQGDLLWYDMSPEEQDEVRSECAKRANSEAT